MVRIDTAKVTPTHIASHMAKGMADSKQTEACPKWTGKLSLCGESQSDELVGRTLPRYRTFWFKCKGTVQLVLNRLFSTAHCFPVQQTSSIVTEVMRVYAQGWRCALRSARLCSAKRRCVTHTRSGATLDWRAEEVLHPCRVCYNRKQHWEAALDCSAEDVLHLLV